MSNAPQKFRKKPVTVEAFQFNGRNGNEIFDWVFAIAGGDCPDMTWHHGELDGHLEPARMLIYTPEGVMRASIGDYVICGVRGEFYPCKPHIFYLTYEEEDA